MGKSSGSIWVSLGLKTSEFTKGIKRSRKELTGFQKFGQGLKGMFNPLTVGVGVVAGLGAAITDAVGIFKDFEKANSDLKAVLGDKGTEGAMKSLSEKARELGASTAFTASEVSHLQKEFAKLGFDPRQINNMAEATLNLASAAGVELSEAATMAGSTLNAFGLKSSDATHVVDVMAKSFSSSGLDMEKLSETMKMAAPIARATGVSFEVATAAAGKLADANISGSVAGTALKRIFSELVKDGKPFQESLNDIAKQMNAASTKAEKLAIAEGKVGNIAKGSLLVLVEQKNALGDLATELNNADGAAKEMAETMLDNLAGDLTKAGSAWEGMILSFQKGGSIIGGVMRYSVQYFTKLANTVTNFGVIWKKTFSGIGSLTTDELKTAFKGGVGLKESEMDLKKITDRLDKMPLKKIAKNTDKIRAIWDKALGGEAHQKAALFAEYLQERVRIENELKESSKGAADATKEGSNAVSELTDKEKKAALEARNLTLNLKALKDVKLGDAKFLRGVEAIDGLRDKMAKTTKQAKPFALPLRVIPELEFDTTTTGPVITGEMIKLGEQAGEALTSSLKNTVTNTITGLGEAIGSGAGFDDAAKIIVGGMADLLSSFGQQLIALGVAQAALKVSLALGPLGAGTSIAAGTALVAVASGIKSSLSEASAQPFAAGGLVFGPTMGLVGEGKGTTPSNPEVIAPLDKLKSFMPQGDGMGGKVEFEIKGTNLVGVLNRAGKSAKYSN